MKNMDNLLITGIKVTITNQQFYKFSCFCCKISIRNAYGRDLFLDIQILCAENFCKDFLSLLTKKAKIIMRCTIIQLSNASHRELYIHIVSIVHTSHPTLSRLISRGNWNRRNTETVRDTALNRFTTGTSESNVSAIKICKLNYTVHNREP
jgi:hypothetical protein